MFTQKSKKCSAMEIAKIVGSLTSDEFGQRLVTLYSYFITALNLEKRDLLEFILPDWFNGKMMRVLFDHDQPENLMDSLIEKNREHVVQCDECKNLIKICLESNIFSSDSEVSVETKENAIRNSITELFAVLLFQTLLFHNQESKLKLSEYKKTIKWILSLYKNKK